MMRVETRLWAIAGGLSLATHALLGLLALALIPEPVRQQPPETTITIEEPATGTQRLAPAPAAKARPAPARRATPFEPRAQAPSAVDRGSRAEVRDPAPVAPTEDPAGATLSAAGPQSRLRPDESRRRTTALASSAPEPLSPIATATELEGLQTATPVEARTQAAPLPAAEPEAAGQLRRLV